MPSRRSGRSFPQVKANVDLFCWNCGNLVRAGTLCRSCRGMVQEKDSEIQQLMGDMDIFKMLRELNSRL